MSTGGNLDLADVYSKYWRGRPIDNEDYEAVKMLWMKGFLKMYTKDGRVYAIDKKKKVKAADLVLK